ncbi:hypothetical protein AMTRI_Chr07g74540 [Amborella trichopoda]
MLAQTPHAFAPLRSLSLSLCGRSCLLTLLLSLALLASAAHAQGNGNGNNGNGNNGDTGNNGKPTKPNPKDPAQNYMEIPPNSSGQEGGVCRAQGRCFRRTLTCPAQCSKRKPRMAKKVKGCFIDCSKCETTCKFRKPNCEGYGAICYDPRFIGGDGVMFYFHGGKGENFALVSDSQLQINAHFIGSRPQGRTRDFTWIQALAVLFQDHTFVLRAKPVATSAWNDSVDAMVMEWDGAVVSIADGEDWVSADGEVTAERTAEANAVRVAVGRMVEMDVRVAPIGEEERRVHNYRLPEDDAFAHLEMQFRFKNLTDGVEGVLGQTYRPGYTSPVKRGVAMPMMGGEDRYRTPSLLSPQCTSCRFNPPASTSSI